ncbi:beta-galactosidase trimerization domain-containing protein [Verrucomicrobiota bacterium]
MMNKLVLGVLLLGFSTQIEAQGVKVGIYHKSIVVEKKDGEKKTVKFSMGSDHILAALQGKENVAAKLIPDLGLNTIKGYQVIIIPDLDLDTVGPLPESEAVYRDYRTSLPAFAAGGGGVILAGRGTAYNWMMPHWESPFPEIGEGVADIIHLRFAPPKPEKYSLHPFGDHPVTAGLETFYHPDLIKLGNKAPYLSIGPKGKLILTADLGYAFGVVGEHGLGRVFVCSIPFGVGGEDAKPVEVAVTPEETQLLVNAIKWLADPRKKDTGVIARQTQQMLSDLTRKTGDKIDLIKKTEKGVERDSLAQDQKETLAQKLSEAEQFGLRVSKVKGRLTAVLKSGGIDEHVQLNCDVREALIDQEKDLLDCLLVVKDLHRMSNLEKVRTTARTLPKFVSGYSIQYCPRTGNLSRMVLKHLSESGANIFIHHYGWDKKWPPAGNNELMLLADYYGVHGVTMRVGHDPEMILKDAQTFNDYPNYLCVMNDEPILMPFWALRKAGKGEGAKEFDEEKVTEFKAFVKSKVTETDYQSLDFDHFLENMHRARNVPIDNDMLDKHQVLWSLSGIFAQKKLQEYLGECRAEAKRVNPGMIYSVDLSPMWDKFGPCASYQSIPALTDTIWTDIYAGGGYYDRLFLEFLRSSGKHTVLWNGWHNPYPDGYERSCLAGLLHANGILSFTFTPFYPKRAGWGQGRNMWNPQGYKIAKRIFALADKAKDYLYPNSSAAQVVMACSEKTHWNHYYLSWHENLNTPRGIYIRHLNMVYAGLLQNHILTDAGFTENLTEEYLSQHKVLILPVAESMSEKEVQLVRSWVKRGGLLIATGTTSLYDEFGRKGKNYLLADCFGVDFVEGMPKGQRMTYKELKEVRKRTIEIDVADPYLPSFKKGEQIKYTGEYFDGTYYSDIVKARAGAKTIARWNDGTPVIVVNDYGKGKCCFIAATWLGLTADGGRVFSDIVDWMLKASGIEPSLKVENCPSEVEVNLRVQHDKQRMVLFVENVGNAYEIDKTKVDPYTGYFPMKANKVAGIKVAINIPSAWKKQLKCLSMVTDQEIPCKREGNWLKLEVPEFGPLELIAVR